MGAAQGAGTRAAPIVFAGSFGDNLQTMDAPPPDRTPCRPAAGRP